MRFTQDQRVELASARRDARIHNLIDIDLIKNAEEAILLTSLLKAYGDSSAGFLYYSPGRAKSTDRPPDAVLCHPDTGLLVIEAKGHTIDQIEGVEAGHILIRYTGRIQPKNIIQQVENQMFEIKNDAFKLVRDEKLVPITNSMVAFPNIYESEWVKCGYDKSLPTVTLLFKDHFESKSRLRQRIAQVISNSLQLAKREYPLDVTQIETIQRVFGKSSVINDHRRIRPGIDEESLGNYIDEMIAVDKYLSREQQELSRMHIDDSPRLVRGVAGSGKSIVLANLVARYIHRRLNSLETPLFPKKELSIAVTCFNRALVDYLRQKIRMAYREQTLKETIPSSALVVSHLNGLMYHMEKYWRIGYIPVNKRKTLGPEEWAKQYRSRIHDFASSQPEWYRDSCFDIIFVDEGQDFAPEEYRLLLDLIKPNAISGEKPLVIFYDDAQNIYGRPRPVWRDIGINVMGERSYVMRECFRNTRQIVELAFNVLLGSQAPADMKVRTRTYTDINYLKERKVIEEAGDHIRVGFAEREDKKPEIRLFPDESSEIDWVSGEIFRLINDEHVRTEDILVLFSSQSFFDYQTLINKINEYIPELEFILPFGSESGDKDRYILQAGKLTLSTVHGAKGYDAPIVFIVGADKFNLDREGRASFYVGATRAKLFLYLTGIEKEASLLKEAQSIRRFL